ncbi:MAG: hypothetical protein GF308_05395 [Candidatus Heimdallarchaeota archaeon]|nr:hypothetical protein [Candidatus Heimdallarchaeota archaeon]
MHGRSKLFPFEQAVIPERLIRYCDNCGDFRVFYFKERLSTSIPFRWSFGCAVCGCRLRLAFPREQGGYF